MDVPGTRRNRRPKLGYWSQRPPRSCLQVLWVQKFERWKTRGPTDDVKKDTEIQQFHTSEYIRYFCSDRLERCEVRNCPVFLRHTWAAAAITDRKTVMVANRLWNPRSAVATGCMGGSDDAEQCNKARTDLIGIPNGSVQTIRVRDQENAEVQHNPLDLREVC